MNGSIYNLAPDALRAKVAQREQWRDVAQAEGRGVEAAVHERMRGLYMRQAEKLEAQEVNTDEQHL